MSWKAGNPSAVCQRCASQWIVTVEETATVADKCGREVGDGRDRQRPEVEFPGFSGDSFDGVCEQPRIAQGSIRRDDCDDVCDVEEIDHVRPWPTRKVQSTLRYGTVAPEPTTT